MSQELPILEQRIAEKRKQAVRTGVPLIKILTTEEAAFWKETRREHVNAKMRESYARNRTKEIEKQIRKQKTPEGKAAKLFLNTLARARRWHDTELEAALLRERSAKGKNALIDVAGIMNQLGRGRKWRTKPVEEFQPKKPRVKPPSKYSLLTKRTIFERGRGGDTVLHRAIKRGKLAEVSVAALSLEIFMVQNDLGRTPLHYAAHLGCLNLIPREYLTRESITVRNSGGNTPIHIAAEDDHLDQIPHELLTDDVMTMENNSGATARDIIVWNARPASDRQKVFLSDLGAEFAPSTISVTQASKLIQKTMPLVPATTVQVDKLRRLGYTDDLGEMTAEEASNLLLRLEMQPATQEQTDEAERLGLSLSSPRKFSAGSLDSVLKLRDRPISDDQLEWLKKFRLHFSNRIRTAYDALLAVCLARAYDQRRMALERITEVCCFAMEDPAFWRSTLVSTDGMFSSSAIAKWSREQLSYWATMCPQAGAPSAAGRRRWLP